MRILIVEDNPSLSAGLQRDLSAEGYSVTLAGDGLSGESLGASGLFDLVVLDLELPGKLGLDVLRSWRAAGNELPVIILTANSAWQQRVDGFDAGADDYLAKPFHAPELLARIKALTKRTYGTVSKTTADELKERNQQLLAEVAKRQAMLQETRHFSIDALAELAKLRDNETGQHILRTQEYVRTLATWLGNHSRYADQLSESNIHLIAHSAPLHDIGKVGIPDSILLKPGKLTPEEWEIMKTHSALGAKALEMVEQRHADAAPHVTYAKQIARHHHEKWDGSGYPDGLIGEDIPLSARLMALADVFDALISKRVYKDSWSHEEAFDFIIQSSGTHFDPLVVESFKATYAGCLSIASQYSD